MKKIIYILVLTLLILSCDKIKSSKYSGSYKGNSYEHYWNTNLGVSYDTILPKEINISFLSNVLLVDSQKKMSLDKINEGEFYTESNGVSEYRIKFSNDSLYYSTSSNNLEKGEYTNFIGIKN